MMMKGMKADDEVFLGYRVNEGKEDAKKALDGATEQTNNQRRQSNS